MKETAKELVVEAGLDQLDRVLDFVNAQLEEADCPPKAQMQLAIAVEEIFVNIAHYAYAPGSGEATIRVEPGDGDTPRSVVLTFTDSGTPFDPLAKPDPDVTLPAEERGIGGLGIYMVKKSMDEVHYAYRDGKNILTMIKRF